MLHQLLNDGCDISTQYVERAACKFYLNHLSTRPISLSAEDGGYEVRITSLASREDYELFAKTINIVQRQTDGQVFGEEDDDNPIADVGLFFSTEWISQQMENDVSILRALALSNPCHIASGKENEIGLYGPVCMFYVGKGLLADLHIEAATLWHEASDKLIARFRYSQ